jgi:hypothetical protein
MDITTSSTMDNPNVYDYMNNFFMDPTFFIILLVVILLYVLLFTSLGQGQGESKPSLDEASNSNFKTVGVIVIIVFGILAIINGVQYFFGIDVMASVKNLFSGDPQIDLAINQTTMDNSSSSSSPPPSLGLFKEQQVFNIPGNYYTYNDAKTLCSAYGARLANYDEVEKAYNNGGEWCNYGWSDGQMALFPTQKVTYDNLQKISGHEHDCGRPGINGGYMANPRIKFGANCYGYKPKITEEEEQNMMTNSPYPKTEKDILMEKRVDYWKKRIDDILVSPFNYKNWNMF